MLSYEMLRWFYRHATGGKRHGILMPLAAARSISSKKVAKGGGKNTCLACHVALQLPRKYSSPAATGNYNKTAKFFSTAFSFLEVKHIV